MTKIVLNYAEDLRENKIAGKVYGKLRDLGFDPLTVRIDYLMSQGIFFVTYMFDAETNLPEASKLDEIFRLELNLIGVRLYCSLGPTSVVIHT